MLRNIMWNQVEKEGNSLQFFFLVNQHDFNSITVMTGAFFA